MIELKTPKAESVVIAHQENVSVSQGLRSATQVTQCVLPSSVQCTACRQEQLAFYYSVDSTVTSGTCALQEWACSQVVQTECICLMKGKKQQKKIILSNINPQIFGKEKALALVS